MKTKEKTIFTLITLLIFIDVFTPFNLFKVFTGNLWTLLAALSWFVYGILPGIQAIFAGDKHD